MRLNVDLPDWLYLQFKKKMGKGKISNNIKNYILLSCGDQNTADLVELKKNLETLKSKQKEVEQNVDLVWVQYQEAIQTRDQLKQDIASLNSLIQEKEEKIESELEEKEKMDNAIKFNTLKERLADL